VATDPKRLKLQLDADPRFAAAAGGAVRYLAEASGMSEEVCREFQKATIAACLKAFQSGPDVNHVIEFLRAEGRIEVIVNSGAGSEPIRIARPVIAAS